MSMQAIQRTDYQSPGFSLIELLVGIALSAFLSLGLVRVASATLASFQLQDSLAEIQESVQVASTLIDDLLRSAAYHEMPWIPDTMPTVFLPETLNGGDSGSDQLATIGRSDHNCFGHPNPVLNGAGYPRFYLKKTMIAIRRPHELILSCSYGPDEDSLTHQIRRQGLIKNVESMQFLFGVDHSSDQSPDNWINADLIGDQSQIVAVRTGLLLRGADSVGNAPGMTFSVLDQYVIPPMDGKLRRQIEFTSVLRGRLP